MCDTHDTGGAHAQQAIATVAARTIAPTRAGMKVPACPQALFVGGGCAQQLTPKPKLGQGQPR